MKNFLKKFLKKWGSYDLPDNVWIVHKPIIMKLNGRMIRTIALLGGISFSLFSLFPFFVEHASTKGIYYVCTSIVCFIVFFIMSKLSKRRELVFEKLLSFFIFLLSGLILLFGIMVGVFWQPNSSAVMFFILFITLGTMFLMKPSTMRVVLIIEVAVFCICTIAVKSFELYSYDVVNALAALLVTLVMGWQMNRMRLADIVAKNQLENAFDKIEDYNRNLNAMVQDGIAQLNEERLASQRIYNANPQINFIVGLDLQIIDCNPAAISFYGYENRDELKKNVLKKVSDAIPRLRQDGTVSLPVAQRIADAQQYGETSFDTVLIFDGKKIPFHFDMRRVQYKGGDAIAVYQTDLREIRRIEESLARRDTLLVAVNEVAFRLLAAGTKNFSKAIWESIAILGKSVNVERVTIWENMEKDSKLYCTQIHEWCEGVGMHHGLEHTINISYSETLPTWEKRLRKGGCINANVKNMIRVEREQLAQQSIVSVLVIPIFIRDSFWGFVGFDDCVNERVFREVEETALKSSAMLIATALQKNEMTSNLIEAKDIAISSTRAKSVFLANMSHEIRTPMNAIIGMTKIAENEDSPNKIKKYLSEISIASGHLLGIINDILDISKIEAEKFVLAEDEFLLTETLEKLRILTANSAGRKQQIFELHCDPDIPKKLIGDDLRFSQVITNLLSNAVKFTPAHGKISLEVKCGVVTEEAVELIVAIKDTGIGLTEKQQSKLFAAFEQADRGTARKYGGTGLGLAISKKIVNQMGGNISISSELGKGSCFEFNVFLLKGSDDVSFDEITDSTKPDTFDFTGKRILLVEDIEINRTIIITLLEETNVVIDCAENGQAGIEAFQKNHDKYDLIFMDIQMPVMDGFDATRAIRAMEVPQAKTIPIVAMTANAFREDVDKCKECGMDDHIAKPIDCDLMLRSIRKYLY